MGLSEPAQGSAPPSAQSGEERGTAVSHLFREHNRALVGFLIAHLKSESEAQEVAQEAYVKLLQLDRTGAVSFLRAYLFRVAKNLAIDRLRQRQARTRIDDLAPVDDFIEEATAERSVLAREELALLHQAVSELPEKCRQAFQLHKVKELSFEETASAMGLTERMVRKYVTRAIIYLHLRRQGLSASQAQARMKAP